MQKSQHFLKPSAQKQPTHIYQQQIAQHDITPQGYVTKEVDELDEIPPYLRERIQAIIDRKVAEKIDEEMAEFKEEIRDRLDDMQQQNQAQMGQYTQPMPVVYAAPQTVPYAAYQQQPQPQYVQYPPSQPQYYAAGQPPVQIVAPKSRVSPTRQSPVRVSVKK